MPELGSSGSVRGARGNPRSYRDTSRRLIGTYFVERGKGRGVNLGRCEGPC